MNTSSVGLRKAETMVKEYSPEEIKEAYKIHEQTQREARVTEIRRKLEHHQSRIDEQVQTIRGIRARERAALATLAQLNEKLEAFKKGDTEAI
jgi:uncharacterized membrane protein